MFDALTLETILIVSAPVVTLGLLVLWMTTNTAKSRLERELTEVRNKAAIADRLEQDLAEAETALRHANEAREKAETRFARLESELQSAERHHAEKLADLEKAREQLKETFKVTASEILKSSGEELSKSSKESLDKMLNPLRDQLKEFREKVETDSHKRVEQTSALDRMVQILRKDAQQMSEDAANLANALRSSSKMQGDWGELILTSILEKAGLREGQEFHTQQTETDGEGARLRPDVVVDMPGSQRLVIDSKVSLKAFEMCVNAESDDDRDAALKQHLASIRAHIKSLHEKNYPRLYEGVSFTLMFIPLEGAASLAFQSDPDLAGFAWERDIMIATPTNLMMAMRTVQNLWTIDRQNQNAREIADRAGQLYDKLVGFVEELDTVGQRLDQAHDAWSTAKNRLSSGRGNVIRQTEMLKSLGAQTKKSLPASYLDAADNDEALPALDAPDTDET
ncbi:DNA recombination protein RmuC [Hyphobacterium indicum]|uniref:DNA recombination protein RmuC n=1 Tax=Hyphobacterium indicum TaxID=2162714 RepID=UPI000D6468D0|nr:DNA recombination protein RmuC [Hyphobacterium indicum]